MEPANTKPIWLWLYACCTLIFIMVIVGAITRLTNSGLSMVEWRPILGFLPPMTAGEWSRVFDLYQSSPEFEKKHFWMDMHDFKQIFFWEWFHRFLGRIIGLVYFLPLAFFWARGMIPKGYKLKFIGLLILGGLQGLMGWYMVKSGLVDDPYVSHYRLAAHLSLAFLLFSLLLWTGLGLMGQRAKPNAKLYMHGWLVLVALVITIFWGAYTAGLDAGLIYNESFPLMGGQLIPETIAQYSPYWINFFETPEGVQFTHRWLAMFTTIAILSLWCRARMQGVKDGTSNALAVMVCLQMVLGITTLLSKVHLPLAVAHQAGALTLLGLMVMNIRRYKSV